MSTNKKGIVAVAIGLMTAGCADSPTNPRTSQTPPIARYFSLVSRTGEPLDVPEVRMDLPPEPRPWDTSDTALATAIAAEDGQAVVAFKEPGSARALLTGIRAAVTAETIEAGLAMLRGLGAEVLDLYDAIGAVHVRIDRTIVPLLRANPLIDYVEPRQHGEVLGVRSVTSGSATAWRSHTVP